MRILPWLLFLLLASPVLAQERWVSPGAPIAAKASYFETSVGYLYFNTFSPSAEKQSFMGIDAVEAIRINARWAAAIDSSYLRANNVLGTGRGGNIGSSLAGPVFYPMVRGKTGIFVRGFAGLGIVDSAVRIDPKTSFGGWVMGFSYLVGGGFEREISRRLALRIGADYQRSAFFNADNVIEPQRNIRLTTGIAYRFERR